MKRHAILLTFGLISTSFGQSDDLFPILDSDDDLTRQQPTERIIESKVLSSAPTTESKYSSKNNWGLPTLPSEGINSTVSAPIEANDGFEKEEIHPRQSGNAKALLNAFIATISAESPWLKKSITRYTDIPPVGFQTGYSKNIGTFAYRPKTWDDLTRGQKNTVIKDPRLKAFLISMRSPDKQPKTEWNYGKAEKGVRYADGYAEKEVEKMRQLVQTLRDEQQNLLTEVKSAIVGLKTEVGGIRADQEEVLQNFNKSVGTLKVEQDSAIQKLNSTVATLREKQGGVMEELNATVQIAIDEHQKILDVLRDHRAEWNKLKQDVYDMMTSATPIEVVTRGRTATTRPLTSKLHRQSVEVVKPNVEILGRDRFVTNVTKNASQLPSDYPNRLSEHDSKDDVVCDEEAIQEVIVAELKKKGSDFLFLLPEGYQNKHYIIQIDGADLIRGAIQ